MWWIYSQRAERAEQRAASLEMLVATLREELDVAKAYARSLEEQNTAAEQRNNHQLINSLWLESGSLLDQIQRRHR